VGDVAIVGAGPTGLTLANILGQAGIRVVLIERREGTVREARAMSIPITTRIKGSARMIGQCVAGIAMVILNDI